MPVGTAGKCDGGSDDVCFTGSLDGNGFKISNLYVKVVAAGRAAVSGLFGAAGTDASLSNIGLVDVYVSGSSSSDDSSAGGLVGVNERYYHE